MIKITLSLCLLLFACNGSQSCIAIGELEVFEDPSCSVLGGHGCNAGGQGMNCRFCGKNPFPPCPKAPTTTNTFGPSTTRPTQTTTPRTTKTTTPKQR